jgi:hypothetical protein
MSKVLFRLYSNGDYAVLDEDGNPIERENRVVANGGRISVPLRLMDSEPVDSREAAWLKMCDRISNAWKQKGDPLPPKMSDAKPVLDVLTPPRVAEGFSGTCPSCRYSRPSAAEGFSGVCPACGYSRAALPAAPAAAYARRNEWLSNAWRSHRRPLPPSGADEL